MFGKKVTKQQVKKGLLRGGIFTLVAAATLFGAYALTPARKTLVSNDNNPGQQETTESTYFSQFLSKVTTSLEEDEDYFGLAANLNDLNITWPTNDGLAMNEISINGELDLVMRNINDLDLTVDINVDYNGRSLDFAIGYVDSDIYLAFQNLKIKSSHNSTAEFLEYVKTQFFDPTNPDGLGIDINLESFIDEKLGGLDLTSLLGGGISLPTPTESVEGNNAIVNLDIEGASVNIVIDKEKLLLKSVYLDTLTVGNVTISGGLTCTPISKVLALDDPEYPKQRGEFVEVISYIGWVDRLLDLFKTRKFGFTFASQLSLDGDNGETKLMDLEASINIDASDVIDFTNLVLGHDEEGVGRPEGETIAERIVSENILNYDGKLEFGAHVSLKGQGEEEYTNIDISFFDNVGYLTLNEDATGNAVLKAKMDIETLSSLIDKVPELISLFTSSVETGSSKEAKAMRLKADSSAEDFLSFLTSSSLITAIKNGDYSEILDLLKDVSNDEDCVNLALNLAPLGLGTNSEVGVKLDANHGVENALKLEVKEIEIGSANLSAQGSTAEYTDTTINNVKTNKEEYDDLAFVESVVEQTSEIVDLKSARIGLEGSFLDNNSQGITLNGNAQFDLNTKVAYGTINLRQYSSDVVNSNKYLDHKIDFDIDDNGSQGSTNMRFAYNDNLKAKITTTTITDIIDLVMELMNSDDARFTKFEGMIGEMVLGSAIGDIISSGDYLQIAKSSFLKSVKQTNGGSTITATINGEILGLDSDIVIKINFRTVEGKQKIDSFEVANLGLLGKTLNLKVTLSEFDNTVTSPINPSDNFMDFSQVAVLLNFGINTTKLGYYHLTASANLRISGLNLLTFDLDFHITVDGETTKVYGRIPNVPWLSDLLSQDLVTTSVNSEFVYEPTSALGGKFHMVRNEDHYLWGKDEVNYYQADSDVLLNNIITYLAVDLLNVKSSSISNLSDMNVSTEKSFDPDYSKLFTDTGFQYSHDSGTGNNTWKVGLNLGELLGNNTLGPAEVTLNGKDVGTSGLFTTANVSMTIASLVSISADITLDNPDFSVTSWPSDIESKYNKVLGWYNNLSASDKARFDSEYKNQPLKTWRSIEKSYYF